MTWESQSNPKGFALHTPTNVPSVQILQDDHDGRTQAFQKVSKLAQAHGSLFVAQLSHPGRQGGAALNPHPISASDVQLNISWAGNTFNKPRAMTIDEIHENVRQWGETAYLCYKSGFDGVQVHCAVSAIKTFRFGHMG